MSVEAVFLVFGISIFRARKEKAERIAPSTPAEPLKKHTNRTDAKKVS